MTNTIKKPYIFEVKDPLHDIIKDHTLLHKIYKFCKDNDIKYVWAGITTRKDRNIYYIWIVCEYHSYPSLNKLKLLQRRFRFVDCSMRDIEDYDNNTGRDIIGLEYDFSLRKEDYKIKVIKK